MPSVTCSNCGGVDTTAIIGVIVAVIALLVAGVSLWITLREHREFMRQLRARAGFKLSLDVRGARHGVLHGAPGVATLVLVDVGIKNCGETAATAVMVNLLVPRVHASRLQWCGPNGEALGLTGPSTTDEVLCDSAGNELAASYLDVEMPRITRRSGYVRHAYFFAAPPEEGVLEVPLRAKVQADELPEDVDEEVLDWIISIAPERAATPR